MALNAGVVTVTVEFAQGLKDCDWFGKQDPYCVVKCGGQSLRTKTAVDGGKNPVWNETFQFNCINDNSIELEIMDEDMLTDDLIGIATFSLAKAREAGSDRISVPVLSKKSRKQHGLVSVSLKWEGHTTTGAQAQPSSAQPQPVAAAPPVALVYYAAPPAGQPFLAVGSK